MLTKFLIEVNVKFFVLLFIFFLQLNQWILLSLICFVHLARIFFDISRLTKNTTFLQAFPDIARVELMVISHMSNKCFPLYYTLFH